jgi:hypothetical protein
MTAKQAAKLVREYLGQLSNGQGLRKDNGEQLGPLPAGLRFEVRATPKGRINVTINDGSRDSYVDRVTGGNRRAWNYREHGQPIVDQVIAYERFAFGQEIGDVKWGDILIAVTDVREVGA